MLSQNICKKYKINFTEEFSEKLALFSKVNSGSNRKQFKHEWVKWVNENSKLVEYEIEHQKAMGYEGDIIDKMFKSSRYYYRKKEFKEQEKDQVKEKTYSKLSKELLESMDEFIANNNEKPSISFNLFINSGNPILKIEVNRLFKEGKTLDEIKNKVKKTYKNRYYIVNNE